VIPNVKKARALGFLIRKIKETLRADEAAVRRSVVDHIDTFNTLAIPRGYVHVDSDGLVHVVCIRHKQTASVTGGEFKPKPFGTEVTFSADVIWDFDPPTGLWRTLKDRTGEFERYCPIKCGGIPAVKPKNNKE